MEQYFEDLMDYQDGLIGFLKNICQFDSRLPTLPLTSHLAIRTSHFLYSVLKLFTGFAKADFTDCILIVKNAIIKDKTAAATKTHALIFVL